MRFLSMAAQKCTLDGNENFTIRKMTHGRCLFSMLETSSIIINSGSVLQDLLRQLAASR